MKFLSRKFVFAMTCVATCGVLALFGMMSGAEVATVMTGIGAVYLGGQSWVDGRHPE